MSAWQNCLMPICAVCMLYDEGREALIPQLPFYGLPDAMWLNAWLLPYLAD